MLKVGLIVNPYAGIGGPLAHKGSDGEVVREQALAQGAELRALTRAARVLELLLPFKSQLSFFTYDGDMGGNLLTQQGYMYQSLGSQAEQQSTAQDTQRLVGLLLLQQVDLILFTGGDGTARNLVDVIQASSHPEQPVVGIPSGVKMHSAVYAITPESAAEVVKRMLDKNWLDFQCSDVKDIDEELFRQGQVRAKWYGSLWTPAVPQHMQQVKNSGAEQDELTKLAIADYLEETLQPDALVILGPGSTTQVIKQKFCLEDTLLGVDVMQNGVQLGKDVSEAELYELVVSHQGVIQLIVTAIGKQGHILGRGNQQISPRILRKIPRDNILVVATREKLSSLANRAFYVDTNDPDLDKSFQGFQKVLAGYGETLLFPMGNPT